MNLLQKYDEVAKQLNKKLPYGSVKVVATVEVDPEFCDRWSLQLDDNAMNMLHEQRDRKTIQAFFDTLFTVDGKQYYIEPYNSRLHNIALL